MPSLGSVPRFSGVTETLTLDLGSIPGGFGQIQKYILGKPRMATLSAVLEHRKVNPRADPIP